LASNFTIINAQQLLLQQQQLTSQPGQIENGIAATATTTTTATTFQSTNDSFSVQVPQGWVIHDLNNTGLALLEETRQGYGMLAQLCPEEEQQQVAAPSLNASNIVQNTTGNNSCQGAQEEIVHIIRYPDLETRIPPANNITAYHLQKFEEVGYSSIQIVNSTDMRVNLTNPQTNQTIATVPAKLVEMTYTSGFTPNEMSRGYFLLTATNVTAPNLGTTKGYSVFYEGNSNSSTTAAATPEITTTSFSSLPPALSLPPAVAQMFDTFELIAAPEVAQALAQQEAAVGQRGEIVVEQTEQTTVIETQGGGEEEGDTACDSSYPDVCIPPPPPDLNCGDAGVPVNFQVLPPDPHGFDGNDNDGIGCETPTGGSEGEPGDGDGDEGDGDEGDGDTSCHPSYPDECIPPPPPNLNCDDVDATNFEVVGSDPHGFDGDNDGIGCESGSNVPDEQEQEQPGEEEEEQEEEQQPEGGEGEGNRGEDDVDAGNGEGGGASNDDARVQGRGASGPADDYG
jgi:hypothetical protein